MRTPEIVWERTSRRVLTLSDVSAIKINDVDGLRAAGVDPSEVASTFAAVMFDQLFSLGFFHADPHPGNLFVTPVPVAPGATGGADAPGPDWRLTFVDFGMMGEVPSGTRRGLRRMLIAAAARDGKGLVEAIQELGALLPTADTAELERAMSHAFARFGGMGFAELRDVDPREFRDFAVEFGELMRSLPFQLPEDFLLIIRAMSLTSGVASNLDPAFNLWDSVEPYAGRLVRDERGSAVRDIAQEVLATAGVVARLPRRVDALITRAEEGRLAISTPRLDRRVARLERAVGRLATAMLFAGLLLAGALLRPDDPELGTALMVASAVPLVLVVVGPILGRRGPD